MNAQGEIENFTDIQNPTIGYSNPAGNNVTTLQAGIYGTDGYTAYAAYRNISKTGSSYTFTLTEQERQNLRYATINSPTLTVRFYIKTVIGGNTFYSTSDKILTIVDADPTFSAAYEDTNASTVAITTNDQQIVRNQSQLSIDVTNLSAKKGATIRTVSAEINGTSYTGTVSGTSCTINVGALNVSSNTTATVTVTDSRAYSTSQTLNISVLNWELPTAIINMSRHNNFYTPTDIKVDGSFSSVDGKNAMTIKIRYKKSTDSTWSAYTTVQDNVTQTFNLDNNYQWDVQILVSDLFGSTTYNQVLSRGMPIIYFDRLKSSVGFNCFPTHENSVEGVLPVVLYEDATGTQSTVTLNETAANFQYLEIFFRSNDMLYNSVKVADPNGKNVDLVTTFPFNSDNNTSLIKTTAVRINGTSITVLSYGTVVFSSNGNTVTNSNAIFITKVVGVV